MRVIAPDLRWLNIICGRVKNEVTGDCGRAVLTFLTISPAPKLGDSRGIIIRCLHFHPGAIRQWARPWQRVESLPLIPDLQTQRGHILHLFHFKCAEHQFTKKRIAFGHPDIVLTNTIAGRQFTETGSGCIS
ncbi:hypothetical protein D3C86_1432450 [compost metagenome]